jgi:hypothetical protein
LLSSARAGVIMCAAMAEKSERAADLLIPVLAAPVLLIVGAAWLVYAVAVYPFKLLHGEWLKYRFWRRHGRAGRFVLFVYSDSPNWKAYVESNLLPRVEEHAVTLNWSRRREWERTHPLEARVFRRWAGGSSTRWPSSSARAGA